MTWIFESRATTPRARLWPIRCRWRYRNLFVWGFWVRIRQLFRRLFVCLFVFLVRNLPVMLGVPQRRSWGDSWWLSAWLYFGGWFFLWFWYCLLFPFFGSGMTSDCVHSVGHRFPDSLAQMVSVLLFPPHPHWAVQLRGCERQVNARWTPDESQVNARWTPCLQTAYRWLQYSIHRVSAAVLSVERVRNRAEHDSGTRKTTQGSSCD